MKKSLLYLLALVCTLNFFTACSDDDDDKKTDDWTALSKTYSGSTLTLTGGSTTGTVTVDATSASAAAVTLTNVVPEAKEIKINATMQNAITSKMAEGGGGTTVYSLSGKTDDNTVSVSGTFSDKGVLSLNVTRALSTPVTGTWTLKYTETLLPAVYVDAATGDAAQDAMFNNYVPAMIGGLMAEKIVGLTIASLAKDGSFDAQWTTVAGETSKLSTLMIMNTIPLGTLLNLQYAYLNDQLMIVVDKGTIETVKPFIPSSVGIDMDAILALMADLGGFYGLPLNFDESTGTFYVTKEFLAAILPIVAPFMASVEDPTMAEILQALQGVLQSSETTKFNFGLTFVKE